jgi:hypothetical protein
VTLGDDEVRRLRARAQRLGADPPRADVADVVAAVVGVQAQIASAGNLSVRARQGGLTAADVERARVEERSIIRAWAMRGTLHVVAAADYGWLVGLLGPIAVAASARRRAELGLDEDVYARALAASAELIAAGGPLTRAELAAGLASRGIDVSGQRAPHLVGRASLEGVLCHGPDVRGKPTVALLADWAPDVVTDVDRARALRELAVRYLRAFAPAGPRDLAVWAGLPQRDARAAFAAIGDRLEEVAVGGAPAWQLAGAAPVEAEPASAPVVRLLPHFDTYLLGYDGRQLAVAAPFAKRVLPGGGWLHPTVAVDGKVVAVWRGEKAKGRLAVTVEPFARSSRAVRAGIEEEAADVARFLGLDAATVEIA